MSLIAHYKFESEYQPSLINYSAWKVGTTGSQVGFAQNGETAANSIAVYNNPWGDEDIVWKSPGNDTASDADGGWCTGSFTIDPTKKYRFSVWIRRENIGSGQGATYFGLYGLNSSDSNIGVKNLGGSTKTNYYFGSNYPGGWPRMVDEWVLFVAHAQAYDYALTTSDSNTGIYDSAGNKLYSLDDCKWVSTSCVKAQHRTYLYYSTKTDERHYWYRPRVDLCDGTEPTISELLQGLENPNLTIDEEVNNNYGIPYGGVTYVSGKIGNCLSFNGTDRYINLGNVITDIKTLTISMWAKSNSSSSAMMLFGPSNGTNQRLYLCHYNSKWDIGIQSDGWGAGNAVTTATTDWTHIALVMDGSYANLFVNGVFSFRKSYTPYTLFDSCKIGIGAEGYFWNGLIDDVRIYDHALSDKEIKELAQAKILHYKFDDFQEYTTNICTDIGFSNMDGGGISYSYVGVENGWMKYSISGTGNSSTYPYTFNIQPSSILVSQRTSFSFKYKTNVNSKFVGGVGDPRMVNISYAPGMIVTDTIVGDYRDAKLKSVSPASGSETQYQPIYFLSRPIEGQVFNPSTDFLYFKDVQSERKGYTTPFVNGTRTGTVLDSSGYDNHAELTASCPQWVEDAKVGVGAYKFNNAITPSVIPYNNTLNMYQNFTVSIWVYKDSWVSQTANQWFLHYGQATTGQGLTWNLGLNSGSALQFAVFPDGTGLWQISESTASFANGWHHLVGVYNPGNYIKLYIDGALYATDSSMTAYSSTPTTFFGVGNTPTLTSTFTGIVDDVRIYNTILSDIDIQELYSQRYRLDLNGKFSAYKINEIGIVEGDNQVPYYNMIDAVYTDTSNYYTYSSDGNRAIRISNSNSTYLNSMIGSFVNPVGDLDRMVEAYCPSSLTYASTYRANLYYYFNPDITKTYRISEWVYFNSEGVSSSNRFYYGMDTRSRVCVLNTTTVDTNFYFMSPTLSSSAFNGRWKLLVYYIYPYGSTGNSSTNQGYYSPEGTFTNYGNNCNWNSTTEQTYIRNYLMYQYTDCVAGQFIKVYRPRVDLIDGTEPPISQLLSCTEHRPLLDTINIKTNLCENGTISSEQFSECAITDGLVAWLPLNGNAMDYTEYCNDGVVSGATVAQGQNQLCYSFDGTDDYIDCGSKSQLKLSTGGTISAWINLDTFNGTSWSTVVVGKGGSSWPNHHYILFKESGTNHLLLSVSDGTNYLATNGPSTPELSLNTWYHVVATWDSTTKSMYLNGSLSESISSTIMPIDSEALVCIGKTGTNGYYLDGKVQDVRIYNRALTAQEVKILYNMTGPTTMLSMSKEGILYTKSLSEI